MKKLRITIGKKTYDVTVEVLSEEGPQHERPAAARPPNRTEAPPQSLPGTGPSPPGPPAGDGAVASPMAGSVKSVLVKQGDEVNAGQPLVILDAMKMENKITAPMSGTVKSVDVKEGQSVQEGQVLLVLE